MTSKQFTRLAQQIFGRSCGWQNRCAKKLKVDRSSVSRWVAGAEIPGPVEAAMTCWAGEGACEKPSRS
jgi:hypothetical protein